ncbi:MAG: glutamate mutase L, partial [Candidatus Cloacimonetes bacterium]|nr:glutamate mutase L [Candidatus Cloacimonadota bacterium]
MRFKNIIITDIGSTTTKALYLTRENSSYKLIDYSVAPTSVEKPFEDVKIGIVEAITKLESRTATKILSDREQLIFCDDFDYLSTSSAGGGLQIFVVGLTAADSVMSATRAAYGVGGVLLDCISIDDGKSSSEKVESLNKAHPDIILFCGGVDNGALFSVYRLAEILKIANIQQKFADDQKIPLVFAGNKQVVDFIKLVLANKYNLHIVPNVRPSIASENIDPVKA